MNFKNTFQKCLNEELLYLRPTYNIIYFPLKKIEIIVLVGC